MLLWIGRGRLILFALPSLALDRAELGGESHKVIDGQFAEWLPGNPGMTTKIIDLRPVGGVDIKFLHQLENYAPATLQFVMRTCQSLDADTEGVVFGSGDLLETVGATAGVLQHKLPPGIISLTVYGEFVEGGVEPPEVSYLPCHVIDRFC